MLVSLNHGRSWAIAALALPIAVFAGYIASIIVPMVVREVVPAVVESVVGH
ncbi:MAG TPA: hypothetical protein VFE01_00150 [Terracidiphilus sp.]|jgi:hypothetical protein|nr:hypothetical protein [Terracidiphilus sp.]